MFFLGGPDCKYYNGSQHRILIVKAPLQWFTNGGQKNPIRFCLRAFVLNHLWVFTASGVLF